ncbi:MAG: type II secretion system protein GspM [Candidatus Dactylopiibacterium sp.]|nr:type II secretion system protein GspM [Candidatus Dactylopiibacterium sp.]
MKKIWLLLSDRFNACAPRERLLIFLALTAVCAGVLYLTVIDPALASQRAAQASLEQDVQRLRVLDAQEVEMIRGAAADPDQVTRQSLAEAHARLDGLQAELLGADSGLVDPARVNDVLHALIAAQRGLSFVSMQSTAVEDLLASAPTAPASAALPGGDHARGLYRHTLKLSLQGDYNALMRYVGEVEKLPWGLRLGEVAIQTEHWPVARLDLTLTLISLERAWLAL